MKIFNIVHVLRNSSRLTVVHCIFNRTITVTSKLSVITLVNNFKLNFSKLKYVSPRYSLARASESGIEATVDANLTEQLRKQLTSMKRKMKIIWHTTDRSLHNSNVLMGTATV